MGGAESALFHFLRYTKKNYHTKHYVAYLHDGPFVQQIRQLNIPVYALNGWFLSYDLGTCIKLYRLIKSIKPDILHTSLWAANFLGRIAAAYFNLPIINELHGDCRLVSGAWKNLLDSKTLMLAKCQTIIAVSQGVKDAYEQTIINKINNQATQGVIKKQLIIIQNGVDIVGIQTKALEQPLVRADIGLSNHDFVIGSVGRLDPIKSYHIMIHALQAAHEPSIKLCLVGDGPERANLEALAKQLGIATSVIFVGQRSDAYRFYPLFDCFALSSQTEGLSLALLEALAFGLPVITTHAHKHHEIITHTINGLLVPVNNITAYANAINTIAHNHELRNSMRKTNLKKVNAFALSNAVYCYQDLYVQMLKKK